MPYIISSSPTGGYYKITDLKAPTYENAECLSTAINLAPSLTCWSEHLRGFFGIHPSSHVLNTIVSFMHYSAFPVARRLWIGDRLTTGLAVGRTHPFLLIGTIAGSLWALNPQHEIVHAKKVLTDRVKIIQHEHRPGWHFPEDSPARQRGACRLLQGFRPEHNHHSRLTGALKKKAKAKSRAKATAPENAAVEEPDGDESTAPGDPNKGILDEPLSRVTATSWNPNEGWGTWMAVAFGSGIVKVMDVGLERDRTPPPDDHV
jgi:transcription factor C subunit 6